METVTSDALNFAWPIRASLVATNALTTLLEMGYGDRLPVLRNPTKAAAVVGRYGNKNQIAVVAGDKFIGRKPLDVLRDICEAALEVDVIEGHLDDESDQVLGEIIEVADNMAADESSVAGQVESVARWVAMQKKMEKDGIEIDSETMCRFDYAWDWIGGGVAETIRNKNLAGWLGFSKKSSVRDRNKRIITPPADTRAMPRGKQIKKDKGANSSTWEQIDFGHGDRKTSYLHPLSVEEPKIWTPTS